MNPRSRSIHVRRATAVDIPRMAASRSADPAAGPADARMTAYLDGRHHPKQALAPRVAYLAIIGEAVAGYIAGHLTRWYRCEGEVQYLYVAPAHSGNSRSGSRGRELRGSALT
jgi:hypothetical protein